MITSQQLKQIFPATLQKTLDDVAPALTRFLDMYEINTKDRIAAFVAQAGHESAGFSVSSENLNYSKDGLLKIFPKYFNSQQAEQYARKPEMIANRVYSNRMGNGPESSGDGYR
jgi:putative chitinase